jgi:hypothetical protein
MENRLESSLKLNIFLDMSSRISKVSFGSSFDDDGQIRLHPDLNPDERKRKLSPTPSNVTAFEKAPAFGLLDFFTLRVIIFDIGIALGDVITDFAQVLLFSFF